MSMASRTVGHNGLRPCRWCNIQGIRAPDGKTYYVPLDRSHHPCVHDDPNAIRNYDPLNLPMRSHAEMRAQAEEIQFADTLTAAKTFSTQYGIKGTSIFHNLSSIIFPYAFPFDFMHLVFENNAKNLIGLWTGTYKDLDEGNGEYQFEAGTWETIGKETLAAGKHIPSAFGAKPPDIADDKTAMTADAYSFWFQYLGPVLLEDRFPQPIYYRHFVEFVKLMKLCLEFELDPTQVEEIRNGFKVWVEEYEKLYYQYDPDRTRACPLTLHALLHIVDGIQWVGPVWTYWAFPMERYCGRLQPAIKSRRHPFAAIDNYIASFAQLSHLKIMYNLHHELEMQPHKKRAMLLTPPEVPSHIQLILLAFFFLPQNHQRPYHPFGTRKSKSASQLGHRVSQWGKVRRLEGGDDMKASSLEKPQEDTRDATWVKYDLLVDIHASRRGRLPQFVNKTFYGQLNHLFVVSFPATPSLGIDNDTTLLLAGIHQCANVKEGNGLKMPYYSRMGAKEAVDITSVQCLVGRIPRPSNQWAILDRSGELQRSCYVPDE
ncbi:hypothetical protein AAF712_016563 [Marasmius tenuissimus]|uniref:Uncharacterized protein n=1 Tax=Marasmius tenuissimus TaxID=585030 RepID=A0ABR2Z5G1_9AGAR